MVFEASIREMLMLISLWFSEDFEPTHQELQMRQKILQELESFVQDLYPDAELALFGSSCNGFGFQKSDLDICMTFKNKSTPEVTFSFSLFSKGPDSQCQNSRCGVSTHQECDESFTLSSS